MLEWNWKNTNKIFSFVTFVSVPRVSIDGDSHELLALTACVAGVVVASFVIIVILIVMNRDKRKARQFEMAQQHLTNNNNTYSCGDRHKSPPIVSEVAIESRTDKGRFGIFVIFGKSRQSFDVVHHIWRGERRGARRGGVERELKGLVGIDRNMYYYMRYAFSRNSNKIIGLEIAKNQQNSVYISSVYALHLYSLLYYSTQRSSHHRAELMPRKVCLNTFRFSFCSWYVSLLTCIYTLHWPPAISGHVNRNHFRWAIDAVNLIFWLKLNIPKMATATPTQIACVRISVGVIVTCKLRCFNPWHFVEKQYNWPLISKSTNKNRAQMPYSFSLLLDRLNWTTKRYVTVVSETNENWKMFIADSPFGFCAHIMNSWMHLRFLVSTILYHWLP